jgi:low affinity Fe/Cu permease
MPDTHDELMPSDVTGRIGVFDRFAGWAATIASRAPFFAFCVVLVVGWLIQGLITVLATGDPGSFLDDKYQLEINTTTTIVTFLMVALLQNSQTRESQATQHKLNAIADGLADLMERLSERYDDDELRFDIKELKLAVGLEDREGTATQTGAGDSTPSSQTATS